MVVVDEKHSEDSDGSVSLPPIQQARAHTTCWYRRPHLLKLNLVIILLVQLSSANGYDGSLINGLQALPPWQSFLDTPTGAWLGFVVAIQPIGQIVSYLPCAWIVQRHGRKAGVYTGYFFLVLGTVLISAAQNRATFIIGRFFMGVTTAFWFGSVPLLITEIAHPAQRGVCSGLWNTGWFLGGILAAWVTYGTRTYTNDWAWRIPSIVQVTLPAVALLGLIRAPESPRWLVANNRRQDAAHMLAEWHAGGRHDDKIVKLELEEIEMALQAEKEALSSLGKFGLVKTRGNRWRLLITISLGVLAQWNGVGVVQYYLVLILESVGITSVTDQTLISGCLQIWNWITAITGALLVDRAGRHKLFAFSNIAMLICYIIITGLSAAFAEYNNKAAGIAVVVFLFLYYGAYDLAYNPLQFAYTVEIWPYGLRARGLAIGLISTALAIMFNTFVNPIALANIGWKYYIVYIVVLVLATAICWFCYPETKNKTLEEVAIIFDGEAALPHSTTANPSQFQHNVRRPSHDIEKQRDVCCEQTSPAFPTNDNLFFGQKDTL